MGIIGNIIPYKKPKKEWITTMNGKKLAQKLRTEDKLLIERVNNDYWISNTYFAVKLNSYDFEDFKSKYNSYKSTETIRELPEEGQTLDYSNSYFNVTDETPISNVIGGLNKLKDTIFTDLIVKNEDTFLRVYQVNNDTGFIDNKYNWLLELVSYQKVFTEELLRPVIFKNAAGEINLLIMPLRQENDVFKEELNKLNINGQKEVIEENIKLKRKLENSNIEKWIKQEEKPEHKTDICTPEEEKPEPVNVKNSKNDDKPEPKEKEETKDNEKKKTAVAVEDKKESKFALLTEEEVKKAKVKRKEKLGTNLGLDYKPKVYYLVELAS